MFRSILLYDKLTIFKGGENIQQYVPVIQDYVNQYKLIHMKSILFNFSDELIIKYHKRITL